MKLKELMMNYDEIESHLKKLWVPRKNKDSNSFTFKKSLKLIVPEVIWDKNKGQGDLNNSHWAYDVSYAFRSSLGLNFEQRVKDKKTKHIWTQDFRINFNDGDLLSSSKGFPAIQVQSSLAMDWDVDENRMFEGQVNYEIFENIKFGYVGDLITVTQMEFLRILVTGQ